MKIRVTYALHFSIMVIIFMSLLSAIPLVAGRPFSHPRVKASAGTNANWSGYVAESSISSPADGFVNSVTGSWKIPTLICNSSQDTYLSTWVGIDGYSDGTVEQIGTEQDCIRGVQQNYAWIEFYPNPSQTITGLTVNNGDVFNASVTYQGNNYFNMSIKDLTTGQSYSRLRRTNVLAQLQSAEWVAESPSSFMGTVLPLANFGEEFFTNCRFMDNTRASYAVDGRGYGTFDSILMNNPNGESAEPSGLIDTMQPNAASSFNVTYSPNPLTLQHDVAITDITLSKTIIGEGFILLLNATTLNKGDYTESFNVTAYANSTSQPGKNVIIGNQTVSELSAGESQVLAYSWNTTGNPYGNYTVGASASIVPGETNTTNNPYTNGYVTITIPGDVNDDKTVNFLDLTLIASHICQTNGGGYTPYSAQWYESVNCDINNDNRVNLLDLILCAHNQGQHW